jgi:SAM-dependent methyltransferase
MNLIQPREFTSQQNADLTFKYNQDHGRHGWLRLTPAYSVKLVKDILATSEPGIRVLDPFCGTGTTPLSAAYRNDAATGIEINPFLAWLGKAKIARYNSTVLNETRQLIDEIVTRVSSGKVAPAIPPPIHKADRWWDTDELSFLCALKGAIDEKANEHAQIRDLFLVGFCRTLIKLSNAAFNHQSMSFKVNDNSQSLLFAIKPDFLEMFRTEMNFVLESAPDNPPGKAEIVAGDSRQASSCVTGKYDLLITSPPYPNRMSYIRELRPYMYWLGYLKNGREAGELDWFAIGGTWGIATSRLAEWERPKSSFYPGYFKKILDDIASGDNKSGVLLSNYVAKYFTDMWLHVQEAPNVMTNGGEVHYIVGNSTFYNVLVPVERLYRDMLHDAGFKNARIAKIRKRNSKKELYEYDVSAWR